MRQRGFILSVMVYALALFALGSCGPENTPIAQPTIQKDSSATKNPEIKQPPQIPAPPIKLPTGFRLDSIQTFDTARNLSIQILIPVSGMHKIDQIVFDEIEHQKNEFINTLDERIQQDRRILSTVRSKFDVNPASVFKDGKVTSYRLDVFYYCGGSAHGMDQLYSFNFDNKTQKRLYFSDYFIVRTEADRNSLTDLIKKEIGGEPWHMTALKDMDFNIEADTISFNFDNYEIDCYAAGTPRAKLHRKLLADWIRTRYQ